jgi:hypothetical protein
VARCCFLLSDICFSSKVSLQAKGPQSEWTAGLLETRFGSFQLFGQSPMLPASLPG